MAADKRNAAGNSCSRCWTSLPTPGATHILPTQLTGRWEDVVAVSRPAQAGTDIRRKSSVKTSSGRRQLRRMSRASEDDVTFRRNGGRRATVSTPDARRDVANFLPRSARPGDARNLRPGNHRRTKTQCRRRRDSDRPETDHRRPTTRDRTPRDSARDTAPPGFGRSGLSADRIITAPDLSWSGQQSSNTVK